MSELAILVVPVFSTLCNAAFNLRREVFIREQKVPPMEEFDADDLAATHLVAVVEGEVCGTLRLIRAEEHMKIGRVAVRRDWRGRGIAQAMIRFGMERAAALTGNRFHISAQSDKLSLYEKLGFTAYGEEFLDVGIPHFAMRNY